MHFVQGNPSLSFCSVLILVLIFLLVIPFLSRSKHPSKARIIWTEMLVLAFCVFAFWGNDWFHYQEDFNDLFIDTNVEDIYRYIRPYIPNYLLFRLIVWGAAFYLSKYTFLKSGIDYSLQLALFCISSLVLFSYARASLPMAMIMLGMTLIESTTNSSILRKLFGVSFILTSFFFHKTAVFGILAVSLTYLILKLKPKYSIAIVLVAFPALVLFLQSNLLLFVEEIALRETDIGQYAQGGFVYFNEENAGFTGTASTILRYLERATIYVGAFLCIKLLLGNNFRNNAAKCLAVYSIIVVALSTVFLFDFGVNTDVVYGRFLRFAPLALVVPVAYSYSNGLYKKLTRLFIYMSLALSAGQVFYSFYDAIT